MYIDSFSLTWYLVAAESKTVKQSAEQAARQDYYEFCKCLNACEDLAMIVFVYARRKMSACFTDVTSITTCTGKFLHNACTEPSYQGENLSR